MAYYTFDDNVGTLQTDYSPLAPTFKLTSKSFPPLGADRWAIFELGIADGWFTPGERVGLAPVDWLLNHDPDEAVEATFVGVTDIDGDGRVDGAVVEDRFAERVLTDLSAYIDYTPYSDQTTAFLQEFEGLEPPVVPPPDDTPEPEPTPQPLPDGPSEPGPDDVDGGVRLRGTAKDDRLAGTDGDDRLLGRGGDDALSGGRGMDVLRGGAGDDRLKGGAGDDSLLGQKGHDRLHGNGGADALKGGGGRDELRGGGGKDMLFGQGGADELDGNGGRDVLKGGSGRDVLDGGGGIDTLAGGGGADRFVFGQGSGRDVVLDFDRGADLLEITSGARRFADLEIGHAADGVHVSFEGGSVLVEDVGVLTRSDFDFV